MSTAIEFMQEVQTNEQLQESLQKVGSIAEVAEVAAAHGYTLDEDELADLGEAAQSVGGEAELTDEQLEQVAGGDFGLTALAVLGTVAVGGAVIAYLANRTRKAGERRIQKQRDRYRDASK